jgi:hypothetical protein
MDMKHLSQVQFNNMQPAFTICEHPHRFVAHCSPQGRVIQRYHTLPHVIHYIKRYIVCEDRIHDTSN